MLGCPWVRLGPHPVLLRSISTSSVLNKSNPEWVALKREEKARRENRWQRRIRANPFQRNVGLAHQLQGLSLDPDDPALVDAHAQTGLQPEEKLEELQERTDKYQNVLAPPKHPDRDPHVDRAELALILTQKKCFPKPKSPNLLTYLEKAMIAHLHRSDPALWTLEQLAQSFPATPDIVKRVLKAQKKQFGPSRPHDIVAHDQKVLANWQLLAKGQLELPEAVAAHLRDNFGSANVSKTAQTYINADLAERVKRELLEKAQVEPQPAPAGPFVNIIRDYRAKVQAVSGAVHPVVQSSVQPRLFSDQCESHPDVNVPSPYRDTAVLAASFDWAKDRRMSLDKFRQKYVNTVSLNSFLDPETRARDHPHKVAFEKWLDEEKMRETTVRKPQPLSSEELNEVVADEKETIAKYEFKKPVVMALPPSKMPSSSSLSRPPIEWRVEIPENMKVPGGLYRQDDCYYNENGDFLYRVPNNKPSQSGAS
ncbi:uncharacterized protein LOC131876997 [Tigriopus californicus]|uniref:uncharacterized protein LOC131876997 n=1 Tax=Tigriopus californicus TaxID=6832 RepID=UPI0027DA106A|nr:uncharacterized protein LOC131876997 [Tigriopus californicus]|eukprot:TCALIF_12790-PA protein Name:"Protein of unknown function" AED:0.96 eAED:1.00 QI:0/-1/0/1/-1/1/1/0/480